MDRIIFLDFDGVVNTMQWVLKEGVLVPHIGYPSDGKVNNVNAIGWLNDAYSQVPFDIVITSTWRRNKDVETLKSYLVNAGLNANINVIGKTPVLNKERGFEIAEWLETNEFSGKFVILDDDSDMVFLSPFHIKVDYNIGISFYERNKIIKYLK